MYFLYGEKRTLHRLKRVKSTIKPIYFDIVCILLDIIYAFCYNYQEKKYIE